MNDSHTVHLHPSWLAHLQQEFDKEYMRDLRQFLLRRKQHRAVIYPPGSQMFSALNSTPLEKVRVVILGQDPYHGPGQAHGLCFSVVPDVKIPPSLANIFREIESDLGIDRHHSGYLQHWADQGVLLLNSVLTVERGQAGSHQGKGWEDFTDAVIQTVNEQRSGVIFLLWGSYAMKKGAAINKQKHLVLTAPHPSPLSAYRGFLGCKHFSTANDYLLQHGEQAIDWSIPEESS